MYDNSNDVNRWFSDKAEEKRYIYNLNKDSVVVDLGGYHGDFADKISKKYNCKVYVYEPVQKYFELCKARNATNPLVTVFHLGITGITTNPNFDTIPITIEEDASSILRVGKSANTEYILVSPIRSLFRPPSFSVMLPSIDLLKINVEGAEFDILDMLIKDGYISKVKNIQVQFHNFVENAEARREALHADLSKTHRLTFNYPFVWENWTLNNA